jgi:uncharacterized protein
MESQENPSDANLFSFVIDLAEDLLAAARLLHSAFVDPTQIRANVEHIQSLEEASDVTNREIFLEVSETTAKPLSAIQTVTLIQNLDGAMDALEEAADFVRLYANFGVNPTDQAIKMASSLRQATEELLGCVTGVRDHQDISSHVRAVAEIENAADEVYRAALGALVIFGADPLEAVRWKDVYDRLEESLDRCEETAQFLGSISLTDPGTGA